MERPDLHKELDIIFKLHIEYGNTDSNNIEVKYNSKLEKSESASEIDFINFQLNRLNPFLNELLLKESDYLQLFTSIKIWVEYMEAKQKNLNKTIKPKYTLQQIGMICFYNKDTITKNNAAKKAEDYKHDSRTDKLYQWAISKRIKITQDEPTFSESKKKFNGLIKIKDYFENDSKIFNNIEIDIEELRNSIENEYPDKRL